MGIFDRKPNVEKLEAKKDVEGLIRALQYKKDYNVRVKAADALGEIGDERAVVSLIKALEDNYIDVEKGAAAALAKIGDVRAIEPLIEGLTNPVAINVSAAASALVKIGEPAVEPLIRALLIRVLEGSKWSYRSHGRGKIVDVLGKIGGARAIESLIQVLKDNDSGVQASAASALGEIGDARAIEPLIQALNISYFGVQASAVSALVKIGEPAVEPLVQMLMIDEPGEVYEVSEALDKLGWRPMNDTERVHWLIAQRAWNELAELGELGVEAVELLIQSLKVENEGVRERAFLTLEKIAENSKTSEMLGKIKDERAVEILIEALKDENVHVRNASVISLGNFKDERAVEPLLGALGDEDGHVSDDAVSALSKFKLDERAVEPLVEALNSYRQPGRKVGLWGSTVHNIVVILGEIGDELAVKPLNRIMSLGEVPYYPWSPADDYIDVCTPAKEALEKIQKRKVR